MRFREIREVKEFKVPSEPINPQDLNLSEEVIKDIEELLGLIKKTEEQE